jgi:hypothetical protein
MPRERKAKHGGLLIQRRLQSFHDIRPSVTDAEVLSEWQVRQRKGVERSVGSSFHFVCAW